MVKTYAYEGGGKLSTMNMNKKVVAKNAILKKKLRQRNEEEKKKEQTEPKKPSVYDEKINNFLQKNQSIKLNNLKQRRMTMITESRESLSTPGLQRLNSNASE